jgi:uncharacterized protein (TIGR00661 family)
MKILYAIQGTGNGHLSRATEIIPILERMCDLDVAVSGMDSLVKLPFKIKYRLQGMGFIFGKKGGIALWETYRRLDTALFYDEVKNLPVEDYDLIINDFEPVSAWAARIQHIPCISLSHQSAVGNLNSPKPSKSDGIGSMVLKHYAPCNSEFGFHFKAYDSNIFTPVIRKAIRRQNVSNAGHYTVYLPAFGDDMLMSKLSNFSVNWEVFSKHSKYPIRFKNVHIKPIDNRGFVSSVASSEGVLCGAGFETPAEVLYLGKKLMVIPMKNQYEQHCNAAALEQMGVPVLRNLKRKRFNQIESWLNNRSRIAVLYPDNTEEVLMKIIQSQVQGEIGDLFEGKVANG